MVREDHTAELLDDLTSAMANLTAALDADTPSSEILDAICAEAIRAIPSSNSLGRIHPIRWTLWTIYCGQCGRRP